MLHILYIITLPVPQRIEPKPITIICKSLLWHESYYPFSLIALPSLCSGHIEQLATSACAHLFCVFVKKTIPTTVAT